MLTLICGADPPPKVLSLDVLLEPNPSTGRPISIVKIMIARIVNFLFIDYLLDTHIKRNPHAVFAVRDHALLDRQKAKEIKNFHESSRPKSLVTI